MTNVNTKTANGQAQLELDNGVATITLAMEGKVNKINDAFGETLQQALQWLDGLEGVKGLILASGHKDFCVGADIDRLYRDRDAASLLQRLAELQGAYRKIETLKFPVVAALTGSAIGGGYELALACHHRIAIDDARVQVGLPEVNLGVLPGAGGTQRLPRLIGIQGALDVILMGKVLRAPKAKKAGLVEELAADKDGVMTAARAFIAANPKAKQPWDAGKPIPGPQPNSPDARNMFMAACGMLTKKTAGVYPAPELAIASVQEGLALTFDRALEVEARYFTKLAVSDQAKDMLRTIWYHRQAAEKLEGLPRVEDPKIRKVAILGAGMMGAGLAFISAKAGYEVVLKDIKPDVLDRAMAHCREQAGKLRHLPADEQNAILSRIKPTVELDDVDGSDLVIEAVFENIELKHAVTQQTEPKLASGGVWASNTSALPITDLATVSQTPANFIGMHFFSPVEKMELVEIITAEATSDETLARALAFSRKIKKLPIVVGDGYGFFTTRVFSAYILEGAQLVAEGHDPVLVEWAARKAGMVVPPLQVFDEVTLSLVVKGFAMSRRYGKSIDFAAVALVEKMAGELSRAGRSTGAGFYDYKDGKRRGLWKGLSQHVADTPEVTGVELLSQRLLGLQALEAARSVEDGVIKNLRDAEVGAIFGIGFAPNTGGPLSYIDRCGVRTFVERMQSFAKTYGPRYEPPKLLIEMAASGKSFFDPV